MPAKTRDQISRIAQRISYGALDRLYDRAFARGADIERDLLSDVMSIDAMKEYHHGHYRAENDPVYLEFAREGKYRTVKVRSQTDGWVPIIIPNDGSTPYAEW